MMRLFLVGDDSKTRILMLSPAILTASSRTALADFKKACKAKCEIDGKVRVELDVDGSPVVSDLDELRDGDRLRVVKEKGEGDDCAGASGAGADAAGADAGAGAEG